MSYDDGMGDAFGASTSFTDTMTDIAASVGRSVTGAAGAVADNAHDLFGSFGEADGGWKNPRTLTIGAGAIVAVGVIAWLSMSGDPAPEEIVAEQPRQETVRPAPPPASRDG